MSKEDGETPKAPQIVLKKNIPYLKGNSTGGDREAVTVNYWIYILEKHFAEEGITDDKQKINNANTFIDFSDGEARDVAQMAHYCTTWAEFKCHMLKWLGSQKPNTLKDIHDFGKITWDKRTTNFCKFTKTVSDGINRIIENGLTEAPKVEFLFRIAQANIVTQLTEKTRRKFIDKDREVKDWKTYSKFVTDVHDALQEDPEYRKTTDKQIGAISKHQSNYQNAGNHPSTSGYNNNNQNKRYTNNYSSGNNYNQNKTSHQSGEKKTSRFEQKYDICGKCLRKGHYRYECRNKPKCSICKQETHEFYACPDRRQQRNNSSFLARN